MSGTFVRQPAPGVRKVMELSFWPFSSVVEPRCHIAFSVVSPLSTFSTPSIKYVYIYIYIIYVLGYTQAVDNSLRK